MKNMELNIYFLILRKKMDIREVLNFLKIIICIGKIIVVVFFQRKKHMIEDNYLRINKEYVKMA